MAPSLVSASTRFCYPWTIISTICKCCSVHHVQVKISPEVEQPLDAEEYLLGLIGSYSAPYSWHSVLYRSCSVLYSSCSDIWATRSHTEPCTGIGPAPELWTAWTRSSDHELVGPVLELLLYRNSELLVHIQQHFTPVSCTGVSSIQELWGAWSHTGASQAYELRGFLQELWAAWSHAGAGPVQELWAAQSQEPLRPVSCLVTYSELLGPVLELILCRSCELPGT